MAIYQQKRDDPEAVQLRRDGGAWLKSMRENAGHTQRSFAVAVGSDYYTFISQIETGRGRVPPERYAAWADAMKLDRREFMKRLMSYYDPHAFDMLFGSPKDRDVANDTV